GCELTAPWYTVAGASRRTSPPGCCMTEPPRDPVECLAAARAGSRDALGQALETCRRYLLQIAQQAVAAELRSKGGASDLVQETFLQAQLAFERFHGTTAEELRAWLRQLLLHQAAKLGRHYRCTQKRQLARESTLAADAAPLRLARA